MLLHFISFIPIIYQLNSIFQVKKSILQGNTESKAMLELIGKTRASEGFRELEDEEEEQTEEMKRKMNTIPKLL